MKKSFFRLMSSIFFLAGIFAFIQPKTPPSSVYACTPPPGGLPNYTLEDRVNFAPIVLEGYVVEVNTTAYITTATIEVHQYFKGGGGPSTLTVSNFGDSSICLSMVYAGDDIILFASGDPTSGQLTAFYASQFDAVTPATSESIQMVIDVMGESPILPDTEPISTSEPEEFSAGGEVNDNPIVSFGPLELCLGLLFAPLLFAGAWVVSHPSQK